MLFSISFLLILFCFLPCTYGQQCDRAGLKKFDETNLKATIFGGINLKFPENSNELKKWCKNSNKYLNDGEAYNKKCSSKLFKQIYGIFVYSYRNTLKQHCKSNSKVFEKFVQSTSCYNKNRQAEVSCYSTFIDHIIGAQNAVEKKKIPHLCCSYLENLSCRTNGITKLDGCDETKVETMNNYIRSYLDPVLNFICSDYNGENDKCVQLGAPPMKKKSQQRTKTIVMPIADLLTSFPDM